MIPDEGIAIYLYMKTYLRTRRWAVFAIMTFCIALVSNAQENPPHSIMGKAYGDQVSISWKSPAKAKTLQWHTDYAYNGMAGTGNYPMIIGANEFDKNDLAEYVGMQIDSIAFFPYYEIYEAYALIYEDGVEVVRQPIDVSGLTYKAFNKVKLDNPYTITGDKTLRIAAEFHHGTNNTFFAIIDKGPVVAGKGDLYSYDGKTWKSGASGNFLVSACIAYKPQEAKPTGYNVYCNNTRMNAEPVTELFFEKDAQPIGTNLYSVTALYEAVESAHSYALPMQVNDPLSFRGAARNLQAEASALTATLSWQAPFKQETTLTWCDNTPNLNIGFSGTSPKAIVVNHFTAEELANYPNATIKAINVMFKEEITGLEIVVYEDKALVYNEVVTIPTADNLDKWLKYELTTPYQITPGKDVSIGYYVTHARNGHPILVDAGLPYAQKRIYTASSKTGTWQTLDALNSTFTYNWMLSADIEMPAGVNMPAVAGYKIYRDNEFVDSTTGLEYTNNSLAPGDYSFTVTATYEDNTESEKTAPVKVVIDVPSEYRRPTLLESYASNDTVKLSWDVYTDLPMVLQWYTGEQMQKFGMTNDGNDVTLWLGAKFDQADLLPYDNHEISSIEFFLAEEVKSATAVIYAGKEVVASVPVVNPVPGENVAVLETPYVIPREKDIIIAYKVVHADGKKPITFDMGPVAGNKGSLFSLNGSDFYSWPSIRPEIKFNVVISANLQEKGTPSPAPAVKLAPSRVKDGGLISMPSTAGFARVAPESPTLSGFNIYRNGELLNSELYTEKAYKDTGFDYGDYEYYVTSVYANGWESIPSDPFSYAYVKPNLAIAPYNLEAAVTGNSVKLTWKAASDGNRTGWSNNDDESMAVGLTGSGTVRGYICNKFTPEDLAAYPAGSKISHIEFDLQDENLTKLSVCVFYGTSLVYEQTVTTFQQGKNFVSLDNTVEIFAGQSLMYGYYAEYRTGYKPYATDKGPAIDEKGNVISTNGTSWRTLKSMNKDLDYNWRLWGYIQTPDVNIDRVQVKARAEGTTTYNVYRNNKLIAQGLSGTSYDDVLPDVTSTYYVTAVVDDVESASSNAITVVGTSTGIADAKQARLSVYPVPAVDVLNIATDDAIVSVNIIGVDGRIYASQLNEKAVNVSNLAAGVYTLEVITDRGTNKVRFIKR